METLALVLALLVLGLTLGLWLWDRRRLRARLERLEHELANLAEHLAATNERLAEARSVLQAMAEGLVLIDGTGRVALVNPAATRLLGRVPRTVEGLLPLDLREAVRAARAERQPRTAELEVGAPPRLLRADAVPTAEDGAVLLVLRDVTEARRLEAVRRDFVANASHELKTPVASIRAAAETLRTAADADPRAVAGFAERIEREAIRLSRIVSDLLDLSRLETGGETETEEAALDALVAEEVERVRPAAEEAGVRLTLEAAPVPPVRGSARDLALMTRNLLENAIAYTRPGGRVDVAVRPEGEEVFLTVTDTGIGIPSRDLDRIFERFYRVDRARSRETGGTGLGLSIVRHVVDNHGGSVRVQSELGRGSTFEVRLPGLAEPSGGHVG